MIQFMGNGSINCISILHHFIYICLGVCFLQLALHTLLPVLCMFVIYIIVFGCFFFLFFSHIFRPLCYTRVSVAVLCCIYVAICSLICIIVFCLPHYHHDAACSSCLLCALCVYVLFCTLCCVFLPHYLTNHVIERIPYHYCQQIGITWTKNIWKFANLHQNSIPWTIPLFIASLRTYSDTPITPHQQPSSRATQSPGRETQTPERDRLPHYGPRFSTRYCSLVPVHIRYLAAKHAGVGSGYRAHTYFIPFKTSNFIVENTNHYESSYPRTHIVLECIQ